MGKEKIEVTPEVVRQLATRRAVGASMRDLEAEFGFSRPVVSRILASDLAKSVVKGLTDSAIEAAAIEARRGLSEMVKMANAAVLENLKTFNLEAAKIIYKAIGVEAIEKQESRQQQAIQVILPGAVAPKEVDNG